MSVLSRQVTVLVFTGSQLSARTAHLLNGRAVILLGLTFSMTGLLWLSQLSQTSGYRSLLGPLVLFGFGKNDAAHHAAHGLGAGTPPLRGRR